MRKTFLFFLTTLFSISLAAEKYTIVFNSSNADSSSPTSSLSSIVLSATANCVEDIRYADKIFRAKEGYGIKGGTESVGGEITIGLDDNYHITTMTVYAAAYATKDDTTSTKTYTRGLVIYEQYFDWKTNHKTDIYPYTIELNKSVDSIHISSNVDSKNRWYVQKI